jgi:transporter family protein
VTPDFSRVSAFGWAAVAAAVWGVAPLVEKVGLSNTPATVGVFARGFGVVVALAVFGLLWSPWRALAAMSPRSFLLLALGGFMASFLGQVAFYQALKQGTVSQVTPISGTYPLVAALLGWLVLREPFSVPRLFGALLIVAGVALLRR